MQKTKAQSAMPPPFQTLAFTFVTAAILLALLLPPRTGHAQGIVRGAQQGAYEGSRVAGPVGGIVGGAVGAGVGGAVGVVEGVFGTPYYHYRSRHSWGPNQSSTPRQPRSVARREQRVRTGESQPGSTPPAPQVQAAPEAGPARPATTASTAPPVQPLE
jgi:hypothetical protein